MDNWMSWEGGVDLIGKTSEQLAAPNVIVHVARIVHTLVGSAPGGLIFWQPDATAPPLAFGFVSTGKSGQVTHFNKKSSLGSIPAP